MKFKYLILVLIFLYSDFVPHQKALHAQVTPEVEAKLLEIGLYLQTGTGLPGTLEIGAKFDEKYRSVIEIFEEVFGLSFEFDSSSRRVSFIACDRPGCYTVNNIAIGDIGDNVFRAYGRPTEEFFKFDEGTEVWMEYEGVTFIIGKDGRVSKIYIVPIIWQDTRGR
ncbi:MAG: hypothetical protein IIB94_01280 [Candidatus Marinimicrobia bacterium]|nr:hypothetical protein [Candidatus Neomarinimicrobiota bacterium]